MMIINNIASISLLLLARELTGESTFDSLARANRRLVTISLTLLCGVNVARRNRSCRLSRKPPQEAYKQASACSI